ncbi:hypothetical protein [Roseovarius sp. 217]|uniref:hypothetical protein n=1 Tax=Roseovarius sp. (strain 217) TaxID=314264 RepID=UPI0000685903|nr:hypothetical protein [Roseovarius sp. 217]EAQ26802.1 hypothetical protein ROS217_19787 [Roseovarius sp. 217]EAQ26832.1 hypothetical protein ROS217_19937 [Roseovarius sp. 217]
MQPLNDERRSLLEAKLCRFLDWSKPELVPTIGPSDPSVFLEFDALVRSVTKACVDRLLSYPDDQIATLLSDNESDPSDLRLDWEKFATTEIGQIKRQEPPWFGGGFGHPDYQADLGYWARMPHFSTAEITCLSVGINPDVFSDDRLNKLVKQKTDTLWPAIVFLAQRYKQMVRQFGQNGRVSADRFTYWVIQVELDVPPQFLELLKRYHVTSFSETSKETEPRREDKREIDKVAQLLVAMAIDGYGYDPAARRSSIPREITDAAAGLGIEIHPDTIRKYFRIGAEFLSPDWKTGKD